MRNNWQTVSVWKRVEIHMGKTGTTWEYTHASTGNLTGESTGNNPGNQFGVFNRRINPEYLSRASTGNTPAAVEVAPAINRDSQGRKGQVEQKERNTHQSRETRQSKDSTSFAKWHHMFLPMASHVLTNGITSS